MSYFVTGPLCLLGLLITTYVACLVLRAPGKKSFQLKLLVVLINLSFLFELLTEIFNALEVISLCNDLDIDPSEIPHEDFDSEADDRRM